MTLRNRARIAYDINCQARKEYNEYYNFNPVWPDPQELTENKKETGLLINLK